MEGTRKENKMGVMPVGKLLVNMSLPIMISMFVQALYNVVDSIFVAQIGEQALAAVSLAFPVQTLMIAVSVGTGVGINSLLSRRLGEKRYEDANAAATNGVFLCVVSSLAFALFGLFFSEMFFRAFTADETIIEMGKQYLGICTVFSIGVFVQVAMERILQATGITIYNMLMQGAGAITNIILDPIFIFGWFGLPAMGVAGAAIATVVGQIVAMGLGIYFNHKKNHEVSMSFKGFRLNGRIIGEIYKVGVPSIVMQAIGSVMNIGMNKILMSFTATAVNVFGVYFKLQSFIFMPVFGLTNGMIPIVGYNFGARKPKRIKGTIRYSIIFALAIMAVGLLLFQLFPDVFLRMFNASPDMMSMGSIALRAISVSFLFAAVGIVMSSVFQAIGNGLLSMILSIARQVGVLLPVAYLFAHTIGVNAVWWAFPIAEVVAFVVCLIMYRFVDRKYFKNLEKGQVLENLEGMEPVEPAV